MIHYWHDGYKQVQEKNDLLKNKYKAVSKLLISETEEEAFIDEMKAYRAI